MMNERIPSVDKLFTDKFHWQMNEHCLNNEEDFPQQIVRNLALENNIFEKKSRDKSMKQNSFTKQSFSTIEY